MTTEVLAHGARRKELGQRVRKLRQRKKQSLRSFAAEIGVSAATMSAIENGHTGVNVDRLELIASELGVSPGALLTLEGLPQIVL
ncbi:MAG: TetR family transcriptional regulator, partial [Nocardioidaceae bacterium]|nr:TetR family transcriptional regulator [Nocardioidaceae bacterium]